MTACPIRYQRQVPDRKGKIFYTSITSLSHISKKPGNQAADERWWCYPDRNTADSAIEWIIWLRERSRDPCSVKFLMRLRNG